MGLGTTCMTNFLELKNVTKKYWDTAEKTNRPFLFSNITTEIQQPERIALLGKSGQGKSTLLRVLALLEKLDDGKIYYRGISAKDMDPRAWRMDISYVSQQAVMLPGTILDNLKAVSKLHNRSFDAIFASELMKDVGLAELDWEKQANDLSGGEKQRVALVRSLLGRPSILLLDEVTASLDQESKEYVERLLVKLHLEEGMSFIWVTHDTEQAKKISDRVWFMEDGFLIKDEKTEVFFENASWEIV